MYLVWRVKQDQRQKRNNSLIRICKSANNKSIITLIIRKTKGNSSELSPRRGNARRARDAWRATAQNQAARRAPLLFYFSLSLSGRNLMQI